ncbi:MAG: hypothetical protein COB46_09545 [Rhodospirillaceae bacterium]|nr:MAG: hypothetical protein COB46_09545 [Rhodospirillaceae bacterium]
MDEYLISSENNEALNKVLHEAVRPLSLDEILGNCLDILLSLSWLSVLPKAGILISNQNQDELELVAERNLGDQITTLCAKVAFGYCLCGRAAATKQTQWASCIDERHEVMFEGIAPHGHYNIPILSGDRVMGVIVLYLPHGAKHQQGEIQFLESVADTLAMVIKLHQQADELKAYTQKLVSHTRELRESRNHFEQEVINRTEDLQQALKAEQEYNTLQKQFLTMASHEFRTPLSIIDMTAQRLLKRHDQMTGEQKVERFSKIRAAAQRITGLIESTLSSAKVEEGKLKYAPIQCDLKSILKDCIETQCEMTTRYDIKSDLAELPDQLLADPGHLEQIFTNLLSNAVKYSPDHKQVDVKGWSDNGYAFVTVEDHGIGIPKDEMPKMFNRFFRTSTAAGIPGTGIGLNLVQKLLEMQGGRISFKSIEGEGSTFTVTFPLTPTGTEALDG